VDEEKGIYREEVMLMLGALAEITTTRERSSRYCARRRTTMKRKKPTPEERRARLEAQEARIQALYARAEKIKAELETSRAKHAAE